MTHSWHTRGVQSASKMHLKHLAVSYRNYFLSAFSTLYRCTEGNVHLLTDERLVLALDAKINGVLSAEQ